MRVIKKLNNWSIKEKTEKEIPEGYTLKQGYAIFAPDGTFQEDNLTYEQAEEFCKNNLDWTKRGKKIV